MIGMKKAIKIFYLSVGLLLFCNIAQACGLAFAEGSRQTQLVSEKTLIVWNQKEQTESFIRLPEINTDQNEVGFIVPVPSIPDVGEVDEKIFDKLEELIEARRPTKYTLFSENQFRDGIGGSKSLATLPNSRTGRTLGVEVVKEIELANYDVKVLKASDIEGLKQWLQTNKFNLRPALEDWLKYYIGDKFYLTVFKFKKNIAGLRFAVKPVNIKFKSDQPFYPYRDSSDTPKDDYRNLKIYFLSTIPYEPFFINSNTDIAGSLLKNDPPIFSAEIKYSKDKITEPLESFKWLTVWRDLSVQRPNDDLIFKPSSMTTEILPEANVEAIIKTEYLAYAIAVFVLILLISMPYFIYRLIKKLFKISKTR